MTCLDCRWGVEVNSVPTQIMVAAVILALVLQWRLFQLQVDFGYLLKMN